MKTLKNLFGKNETRKSMQNFVSSLPVDAMLMIKGGDEGEDTWPPKTGTGSGN